MINRTSKIFVTVDAVIFKPLNASHKVLLIKRKNNPYKGKWALPGGFVDEHEDLQAAAARELQEETGLKVNTLQQFHTFGKPHRDPRSHTISVAYHGFADQDAKAEAADDADDAAWFDVRNLPELAFDHDEIIAMAIKKVLS
ncbi:MAG TPA: NUDIX hydrolase [Flavobacterium sp.]|jgi:8-oxo-dGTP diphosphatase|nr:NUDIX hydrolase [Flavobacterium sp.]